MAKTVWNQQQIDGHLPSRIGYKVVKGNQHAKTRIQRMVLEYRGTDPATLSLLDRAEAQWMQRPTVFFDGEQRAAAHGSRDPQLELLRLFLRTERDTA